MNIRWGAFVMAGALAACGGPSVRHDFEADLSTQVIGSRFKELKELAGKESMTPAAYATLAFGMADHACSQYFDGLIYQSNMLRMRKADVTAIGAAAATIMALTKTATRDIGIASAAVGTTAVVLDNVQQYAYLTPYPEETKGLVQNAMVAFRQSRGPTSVSTWEDAESLVRAYADQCSYSSIAVFAKSAISRAPVKDANAVKHLFSDAETLAILQPLKAALGIADVTLSDDDYAYLEIISEGKIDPTVQRTLLDKLPAAVRDKVWDSVAKKITANFQRVSSRLHDLTLTNTDFGKRVAEIKKVVAEGVEKAKTKPGLMRSAFDTTLIPNIDIPPASSSAQIPHIVVSGN